MSPDKPTLNASGVAHGAKHDRPDLLKSAQCIQARPHSSGFKSFLNWFKKVEKLQRQRADAEEEDDSATDASSVSSDSSTATVASFAFLEPNVYRPYGDALQPEKYIASGPYTDTYNRLILERDRRRNLDKNVTLRKKYQLHSSGLTLNGTLKPDGAKSNFAADENDEIKVYDTFSLPAMNKINATNVEFQNKEHRRAASETKFVRPLSYVHVKGKRRAPLPPGCTLVRTNRKKRAAPPPPFITEGKDHSTEVTAPATPTSVPNTPTIEPSAVKSAETIKPALYHSKSEEVTKTEMSELSPRPWYKRQFSDNKGKSKKAQSEDSKAKNKTELPEIGFFRYSKIFDTKKNFNSDFSGNEKRISGIHILPNISELDREASEIISMHKKIIREENNNESNPKIENLANPRSARELITKFNAMQKTNALPSQPNILLDSELIPSNKTPATRLCENEVQKSENKKNESKPVEVKVETSNWTCTKCKFQNKSFQHICSICYTRRTEPVAPTKVTDNLFKSFEAEVFDALSHLGNMSKEETKNSGNKASSSSENKVLSSDENKEASSSANKMASSSANKMASASANKIASASENKVASASEKKVASACERKVASADENKVSALSGNKMPSSSENKAAFTNNNDKNLLKNKEEEKQKLRELLKEMKNSLPKRPKSAIVTSYPGNSPEKMSVQRPAQVNGPKIVDVNVSTKIEPINVKSESNIGINPLYKPKVENISSDIKTQHVEKLDKVIKKSSNKTDSSAQTNDCKESRSVNSTQPAITENLYANVGDKIVIATKKTNADGLVNQNITDLKDPKVLLRKLEMAISKGDDIAAATIARQLAILKINCTVLSSTVTESNTNNSANVEVYIEDQDSHHGPIQLSIGKEMNIAELKQSIAKELNIPINIQRWIIGKQLAVDETEPVKQYNKNDFSQPMFLYLVSPAKDDAKTVCTKQIDNPETIVEPRKVLTKQELKKESPIKDTSVPSSSKVTGNSSKDVVNNSQKILAKKGADHYLELLNLDSQDLIKNMVTFECAICFQDCKAGDGVVLRECLHSFCKECLANTIRYSEEVEIQCPFRDYSYTCESVMQEREIKALVPKDAFEQHLAKSVTVAENSMQKTFHCKSADCKGWCIYEDNVNYFRCPVCRKTNCLTCQAIHEGENCKQYQERIKQNSETDLETLDGQRTKQMLEEMVNKGDAMVCPSCQVVLMKKWGCDWLRCSMCKTEICWVTRGPRWGAAGKGDTTGGCQCGVNGVKCHPKCNYCH